MNKNFAITIALAMAATLSPGCSASRPGRLPPGSECCSRRW